MRPAHARGRRGLFGWLLTSARGHACAQINLRDDTEDVQDYLAQLTGGRSVPRVRVLRHTLHNLPQDLGQ